MVLLVVKTVNSMIGASNSLTISSIYLQFAMVECVVTGLSDEYPKYLRRYKPFFLIGVCILLFLLAIPMCAEVRN